MRKSFLMLFATLLFAALPAFAQHGNHGGGHSSGGGRATGGHESHNSGTARNASNSSHGSRGEQREHHDLSNQRHEGYHFNRGGSARGNWRGDRYDHDYFRSHWGAEHRFYWGHCNWWGPRFVVGSYFWYGGGYWVIVDEIPYDWYDDEVYVEYVDGYGYALINPTFPGVYYHVGVRF